MRQETNLDYGTARIPRMFVHIFIPTFLGMLFSVLFVLTDGIFVGHGVGSDALAAVNIVMPVYTFAMGVGMMMAIGSSVVAAIHLSQNNTVAARSSVTQAFATIACVGVVLLLVAYAFPRGVLGLLGANERLLPLCRDYYLWFLPAAVFIMFQLAGQFIIRLDGSPRYSMMLEAVPASLNVLLDYLFIFPLGMGLKGAALATSISGFVGVLMVAFYMLRMRKVLSFCRLSEAFSQARSGLRGILDMAKVGFSGFFGEFSLSVTMLTGNYMFMNLLGEDGVAAYSVTCYLVPVIFMVYSAISQSAQPILSYNFGAGKTDRVGQTFRIAIWLSVAAGIIGTVLLAGFAGPIVSVFIDASSPAYALCVDGLPLYTAGFVFMAVSLTVIGYFQSIGNAKMSTVLTLLRGLVLPVSAFLMLPRLIGSTGLWLAVPVAESLTAATILVFVLRGGFRRKNQG